MDPVIASMSGFAVTMYITPGPNNVMVASSAATYGIPATVPHMLGIVVGFALMLLLVMAGIGSLLDTWPLLVPLMRWAGAAWMFWLAWKLATASPPGEGQRKRLMGFFGAVGFQWINPKAWMIAVGAAGLYLRGDEPISRQLLRLGLIFLACGMPCLMVWALVGSGAGRLLRSPARLRAFNMTMAGLLLLSVLPAVVAE